ncbi:helix-turn-helix transcriptional regulator [Tichowtungia aerotolerans]|uniref:Helix-turn-helix domain-containing protein n=1 Tax=Tichowtungia aerotolerans TaxID=2697043 RepID=A0A6P1M2V2_9BACT|nr:helix-turn-helix domain-containing protein [Tichowtungia aerotolerans]QHI68422.1 helix-turn-helix domain-containing protein [Tichowtungia aerotolerans]
MAISNKTKPRALKAGAASEYLGISRRYLHDLTKQGRIPYSKIGPRCLVYDIADLDLFLEECKIGGAA